MEKHLRKVQSFVRRTGRQSDAQKYALETYWPLYGVEIAHLESKEDEKAHWSRLFSRQQAVIVEIGFGMGHSLVQDALHQPDVNFLGIEVHTPGVGTVLRHIHELGLKNLLIIKEDALEVFKHVIPDNALQGIHIFFPDPWPKKKHHKRRLIQKNNISLFHRALRQDGHLFFVTDDDSYAQWTQDMLGAETLFTLSKKPEHYHRYQTKYERRGIALSHQIQELYATKLVDR